MKLLLIILFSFFSFFKVNSAEFTFEVYGIEKTENFITSKNQVFTYWTYTNDGVFTSNISIIGNSKCSGFGNVINKNLTVDVLCENKSEDYVFYAKYTNSNLNFENSNILKFEIVDGTGPFKELIGQKCKAAYVPVKESKYLFKGKCDIPTSNFDRMINYKKPE